MLLKVKITIHDKLENPTDFLVVEIPPIETTINRPTQASLNGRLLIASAIMNSYIISDI